VEFDAEKELSFQAVIFSRPEFKLADDKEIKIQVADAVATDEEIDAAVANLRTASAPLVSRPEKSKVESDDYAMSTVAFEIDGKVEREEKEVPIQKSATAIAQIPVEKLFEKIQGKKVGDRIVVDARIPDDFAQEEQRGKMAKFTITIEDIKYRDLPKMKDFLKQMDFDSEEEMREEISKRINQTKQRDRIREANEKITDWLIEKNPFDVPDALVQRQADQVVMRQILSMQREGVPEEEIKNAVEELRSDQKNVTDRAFRSYLILETIAKKRKILVTEKDVESAVAGIAQHNQQTPEKLYEQMAGNGQLSELRHQMRESKVLEYLRKQAGIKEN